MNHPKDHSLFGLGLPGCNLSIPNRDLFSIHWDPSMLLHEIIPKKVDAIYHTCSSDSVWLVGLG